MIFQLTNKLAVQITISDVEAGLRVFVVGCLLSRRNSYILRNVDGAKWRRKRQVRVRKPMLPNLQPNHPSPFQKWAISNLILILIQVHCNTKICTNSFKMWFVEMWQKNSKIMFFGESISDKLTSTTRLCYWQCSGRAITNRLFSRCHKIPNRRIWCKHDLSHRNLHKIKLHVIDY